MENAKDNTIVGTEITVLIPDAKPISFDAPIPRAMPMSPPMRLITTASIKNCVTMTKYVAPKALRIPISRVRSVTGNEHDIHKSQYRLQQEK